jgi:hypothetical protein
MSDDKDLDFTIGVDVDTDELDSSLNKIEQKAKSTSAKMGETFDKHLKGHKEKVKETFQDNAKTAQDATEQVQQNTKKATNSFAEFLTGSTQRFKNFFNENSNQINGFVKNSFGGLSSMAGALGIGLTGRAFVNAIGENAQLGYKSGGLHTTPNKLSAFQQGARQIGVDAGETDALFARIAQMQTDQFSPDAVVASQAMQYLTRINTLLGISNKNADGSEKQTNKYILDILQSQSLRTLSPLAQEGMLQKALGVSTVTAHQLLQPNLLPAINKAESTTAITDKEADEAMKADAEIQTWKNKAKKTFAKTLTYADTLFDIGHDLKGVIKDSFHGSNWSMWGGLTEDGRTKNQSKFGRDFYKAYKQTWLYDLTKGIVPDLDVKNTRDDLTPQMNYLLGNKNISKAGNDLLSALINNPQLTNAQRMKESGGYNYAVGSHGELGAFQLMPKTANEIGGKQYTADELFNYDTNKMLRDKYLRQGMEKALQYAKEHHMQLSQEQLMGSGYAWYNGGYRGLKHYMETGSSYNGYAEDIMQKANVNLTQNITINGVDTKDSSKVVSAIKSVNKKDWLSLQLNNTRAYQN